MKLGELLNVVPALHYEITFFNQEMLTERKVLMSKGNVQDYADYDVLCLYCFSIQGATAGVSVYDKESANE